MVKLAYVRDGKTAVYLLQSGGQLVGNWRAWGTPKANLRSTYGRKPAPSCFVGEPKYRFLVGKKAVDRNKDGKSEDEDEER